MTVSTLDRVRPVLELFPAGASVLGEDPTVTMLAGGRFNSTLRVRAATVDWVVRRAGFNDETFGIHREQELRVLRLAARFGFAPTVVYADPLQGALVTAYVDAPPLAADALDDPACVALLGRRLHALHQIPVPADLGRVEVPRTIARYLASPSLGDSPVPRARLKTRLLRLLADYRRDRDALCHHDLHHGNILGDDPLCFIDWEYGGVGDPLFELAAVISYHDLSATLQDALVSAYDPALDRSQLAGACVLFDGLHALWLDAANDWSSVSPARRDALIRRLAEA